MDNEPPESLRVSEKLLAPKGTDRRLFSIHFSGAKLLNLRVYRSTMAIFFFSRVTFSKASAPHGEKYEHTCIHIEKPHTSTFNGVPIEP